MSRAGDLACERCVSTDYGLVCQAKLGGKACPKIRYSVHDGEPLIGNRVCTNCERTLFDHCEFHLVPCCPGKCPGMTWLQPARRCR